MTSILQRTTPIFPLSKFVKNQIYYEYSLSLSPAIGSVASYAFSANGLYDPNITGTGHQPLGFDQMELLYEHYNVLHSHCKVTFANSNANNATRVAIFIAPDTTTQAPTSIMENGLCVTDVVIGGLDGANRMKTLEIECDIPKYFGRTREGVISDTDLQGTAAANPTEQVYFIIAAWNPFDLSAATSIIMDVVLSYDAYYSEPRKLIAS